MVLAEGTKFKEIKMKAYMGYDNNLGSEGGAVLIFANTAKEAKKVAYSTINGLWDTAWIDVRVRWLRVNPEFLFQTEADQEKVDKGIAHVIDSPATCRVCNYWGEVIIGGVCSVCIIGENSK